MNSNEFLTELDRAISNFDYTALSIIVLDLYKLAEKKFKNEIPLEQQNECDSLIKFKLKAIFGYNTRRALKYAIETGNISIARLTLIKEASVNIINN